MSNLSVLLVHPDETVHAQFDDLYVHAATSASHQAASTSPVVVSHAWSFAAAVTQLEGAARTGNHFAAAFVAAQWSPDDDRHAPATGFALDAIAQLWEVDPQLQVALLAPPGSDVDVDRSTTSLLVLRTPLTSPDILVAARFLGARRYASDEALAKVVAKERERARELEGIIAELEREKALRRDAEDELVRAQRQEAVGQLAALETAFGNLAREAAERERIEAQMQRASKRAALWEFTAGIVQNINTSMQCIGDSVFLVEQSLAADEPRGDFADVEHALGRVQDAMQDVTQTVHAMELVGRVGVGRVGSDDMRPVDLTRLMHLVLRLATPRCEEVADVVFETAESVSEVMGVDVPSGDMPEDEFTALMSWTLHRLPLAHPSRCRS